MLDTEYDPSDNLNFTFNFGADISDLLFLCDILFFPCIVNEKIE